MIPRFHDIPDEAFAALAAGNGGARSVRHLTAAQYSKHLLLIRGVMDQDPVAAGRAYDLLAEVQERDPAAVDAVLRHPAVGAWAHHALTAPQEGGRPTGLGAVAAAAALRAGVPFVMEVPLRDGAVMLPSLGKATLPGRRRPDGVALVRSRGEGAQVQDDDRLVSVAIPADPHQEAPGWQALKRLSASASTYGAKLSLLIDDLDPFRLPAGTPGTRLGAAEARAWQSALGTAWALLIQYHWTTAAEIRAALRVLTPLPPPPQGQVSATARQAFGCAAMSTPVDGRSLAVTLAHEVQHAKLSALLDVVALTLPDHGRRYYAPWRDDPRPISGLLQGTYAYLGVSGFWRRQRHHEQGRAAVEAHAEFARWRTAARTAAETMLASEHLTPAGEIFVAGMLRTLRTWGAEDVPDTAMTIARRVSARHRLRWHHQNQVGTRH